MLILINEKEYGQKIMEALVDRALLEGTINTYKDKIIAYNTELNSKFIVNNSKLAENFNFIADGLKFITQSPVPRVPKTNNNTSAEVSDTVYINKPVVIEETIYVDNKKKTD